MGVNLVISDRIKKYRTAMGMTQEAFASEIGLAALQISCIERGTKGISLDKLLEISKRFHISMDELVSMDEQDDTLKEQWIDEISNHLRTMDAVQIGVFKQMIGI